MKRKLSKISLAAGLSGVLAAGLAGVSAAAAKAAAARTPAWSTVLSLPDRADGSNQVDTVVATGKTSGWAFLSDGTAYERTGAASWKKVAFPGTGGSVNIAAASSPSNVWAAYKSSTGGAARLYHWNGRTWKLAKTFAAGSPVTALSVLGAADVWAFGGLDANGDGVSHFNGRTWTQVSTTLQGGSALSDSSVWAFNGARVAHFNGKRWITTTVASLLPAEGSQKVPSYLTNILALGPGNVYATGEGVTTPKGGPGVLLHYNGHKWSRVAESSAFESVAGKALAADGAGGLWIAAQNYPATIPELFHYSAGELSGANLGATGVSVSRIPGTAEALAGGFEAGTGYGDSAVLQYS